MYVLHGGGSPLQGYFLLQFLVVCNLVLQLIGLQSNHRRVELNAMHLPDYQ